ncbi:TPA: hypothetical protein ACPHW8_004159 [Vibrio alginolyticus]
MSPEWDNVFNLGSWATYDAHATAAQQDKPALFVASEAMATTAGTHGYLEKAGDNVQASTDAVVNFFDQNT